MRTLTCLLLLAAATPLLAADSADEKPVPVTAEPYHKTVFENNYVRVIDVQMPPGVTSKYHIHVIPSIVVDLARATIRSQPFREQPIAPRTSNPGFSRYAPYDEQPLTHRVTNISDTLFRVLDIELLHAVPASVRSDEDPFPLKAAANVAPKWQKKRARASNITLAPNERFAVPASDCAHLLINTSGSALATTGGDAKKKASTTLASQAFAFYAPQSGFAFSNSGADKAEIVLIELR